MDNMNDLIKFRYDGKDASGGQIDLLQLSESLSGASKIISSVSHFYQTGEVQVRSDLKHVKVMALAPKRKCYEIAVVLQVLAENKDLFREVTMPWVKLTVKGLLSNWIEPNNNQQNGENLEMIAQMLKDRDQHDERMIDRMMNSYDLLVHKLHPAGRQLVVPVSASCDTLIINPDSEGNMKLGDHEKHEICKESEPEIGESTRYTVTISEVDCRNCTCKVELKDGDSKRIPASIADPLMKTAGNPYVQAVASLSFVDVVAKAEIVSDEIVRLHISDFVS